MKYMLLIYFDEQTLTEDERQKCYRKSLDLTREIRSKGQYLASAPLHNTAQATSLRVREGKKIITDGPFAETHEQLGGYYLVDVEDLDEALSIASRIPGASYGTVELRPVIELPELAAIESG